MADLSLSDYNLEFAHVQIKDGNFDYSEVLRSAQLAVEQLGQIESKKATCSICILIDDKHVTGRVSHTDLLHFLDFVERHIPRVDYICFERALSRCIGQIFGQIRPEHRERIETEVSQYQRRHKQLACSHDIATWHLMRLGLLENVESGTIIPVGLLRGIATTPPPFNAKRLISVLSEADKTPEEKALDDILRYCTDDKVVSRIDRIYYTTHTANIL